MAARSTKSKERPRELRRRVMACARLRCGAQWGDAQIPNISSRRLLIQTLRSVPEGSMVEITRGDQLIVARVVWSAAGRTGLRTDPLLRVEDILSVEHAGALRLIASDGVPHDRRRRPRVTTMDPRLRGRAMEFLAVGTIAISLAVGVWSMVETALVGPLARVAAALGG